MEVDVEYKKAIAGDRSARKDLLEAFYAGIEVDVVDQWLKKAIADKDERLVFAIADWFEEVKKDHKKYLEVLKIASDMGNEAASYWLGEAYREGKICAREFDKALEFYRKADQQGADFEEVFANPFVPDEAPIRDSGNDGFTLDWWKFVLERYPTPVLKNALECAEKTGVDAAEDHAAEVGVVSKRIKELEVAVLERRDLRASAELAIAYLDGKGCPKDKEKAFRYAKELLFEDEDFGLMGSIADRANSNLDAKEILVKLNDMANEVEKDVGENYEEPTTRSSVADVPGDDWKFPNGHDDGEAPDTEAFGG